MRQRKCQIFAILWRERGDAQVHARQVDAFVFAEFAAIGNFGDDGSLPSRFHAQFNQSVRQQDSVAALHFARKALVGCRNAIARALASVGRYREPLPRAQGNRRSVFECTGANFRALQVRHQRDRLLQLPGRFAQPADELGVMLMRAVREIQARDVHSHAHQASDHGQGIACGTERANNFSVPEFHGPPPRARAAGGEQRRNAAGYCA